MKPTVQVRDLREARTALRRLDRDLPRQIIPPAMRRLADELVVPAVQRTVPVRSGLLRSTVRGSGTQTRAQVRVGKKRVPYAGVINYGWPGHNIAPSMFLQRAASTIDRTVAVRFLRGELAREMRRRSIEVD